MPVLRTLPAAQARARLSPLIEDVAKRGPVRIVGRRGSVVAVSADEWHALQETLFIRSNPVYMRKIRASERAKRSRMKPLASIR
jgi:prevent-host-death family protein